jgi:hypothetical protein
MTVVGIIDSHLLAVPGLVEAFQDDGDSSLRERFRRLKIAKRNDTFPKNESVLRLSVNVFCVVTSGVATEIAIGTVEIDGEVGVVGGTLGLSILSVIRFDNLGLVVARIWEGGCGHVALLVGRGSLEDGYAKMPCVLVDGISLCRVGFCSLCVIVECILKILVVGSSGYRSPGWIVIMYQ